MADRTSSAARDAVRAQLQEATAAAAVAAQIIRPYLDLFDRFEREALSMESVGPILDPSLFMSSERRAAESIVRPVFKAAATYVRAIDMQARAAEAAFEKVSGGA